MEQVTAREIRNLQVDWSEPINQKSALSAANYQLENENYPTSVTTVSASSVQLLFANDFPIEKEKTLSVRPIADLYGNQAASTKKLNFIFDNKPPQLLEAVKVDDSTLRLHFHEQVVKSSAITLSNFDLDGESPSSVSILGPDSSHLLLSFSSLSVKGNSTFTFKKIEDLKGNVSEDSILNVSTVNPNLVSITALANDRLSLLFSQPMDASIENLTNYTLSNFTISSIEKPSVKGVVLRLSDGLSEGDSLKLEFSNLMDENGNALLQDSAVLVYERLFHSSHVLDAQTVMLHFDSPFTAVSTDNFSLEGKNPVAALLDGSDKKVVRLLFADLISENEPLTLAWTNLTDVYDRRLPDSQTFIENDRTPAKLIEIKSDLFGIISLHFDEAMEESSATSTNLFEIIGIGNPLKASLSSDSVVTLTFGYQHDL